MSEEQSTIATAAGLIARTLQDYHCDVSDLFAKAGVDLSRANDPTARVSAQAMQSLWRLALEETGDECLGLSVAEHMQPAAMHGLGFAWLASNTLYDALKRLERYQRALSTAASFSLQEAGQEVGLVIEARMTEVEVAHATLDMGLAVFLRMCRLSYNRKFRPKRVSMGRPRPDCSHRMEVFFNAPIEYGAAQNALWFERELLMQPLPNANPALARANDQVVIEYLDRFDRSLVAMQVRARLIEMLPAGQPTQGDIAVALNMSLRNLQRKLQVEGTNYRTLLDETRRELAIQYIRETHRPIGEIAWLLGFAETSNFTRAFRRWTGVSPNEYRRQTSD